MTAIILGRTLETVVYTQCIGCLIGEFHILLHPLSLDYTTLTERDIKAISTAKLIIDRLGDVQLWNAVIEYNLCQRTATLVDLYLGGAGRTAALLSMKSNVEHSSSTVSQNSCSPSWSIGARPE